MAVFKSVFGSVLVLLVSGCGSSAPEPSGSSGAGAAPNMAGSAGMLAGAGGSPAAGAGGGTGGAAVGGAAGVGGASGGAAGAGAAGSGPTCQPPADVFSPITKLTETGCVDPTNPAKPTAHAVSYEVNSPLWSDSADKTRAFVLPAGGKIHVRDCVNHLAADCPNGSADDGRWSFPVGTVMIKTFGFDAKIVETRLFMHIDTDNWVGYNYQWNEAQTEATLVSADGAEVMFNTGKNMVDWHYPSQKDCVNCHNKSGGSTLGPETAQFNRTVGGMNQIDQIAALGLFETPPAKPYKAALVSPYPQAGEPTPSSDVISQRARSYLHANCGFCHRPGGNFANFDLRNDTPIKDMKICNAESTKGAIANAPGKTKIVVAGTHADSLMWLRMNEVDEQKGRMPQIASFVVDHPATDLVGSWIDSLNMTSCPQ